MIKTILLVDDDEGVRDTLRRALHVGGFEVVAAGDGKEALRRLAGQKVDLVITDIIMPEMEGVETILQVRRTHKDLPIIAMSGGARIKAEDCLDIAKAAGANLTLAKPFTHSDLLDAVRRIEVELPQAVELTQK